VNAVAAYLAEHRERLALERHGVPEQTECLVLTPRFRLSRHVIVLVFAPGRHDPVLVAKLPRLPGDADGLRREAANLRAAEAALRDTRGTAPVVVAFDEDRPYPILLETALAGRPLSPAVVRRGRADAVRVMTTCLSQLARATRRPAGQDWHEELLAAPLARLVEETAGDREVAGLAERTLELAEPLRAAPPSVVLEHGDLGHPNLVELRDGRIGILDWETGTPRGLPLHDLIFFLTYAAVAGRPDHHGPEATGAIDAALVAPGAWGWPALTAYGDRLGLARELLAPLVVACAGRAVALLPERSGGATGREALPWLRASRPMTLWRHAVAHAGALYDHAERDTEVAA
jgi:hypothetical protein